ncbi:MAG TPA: hypothetical protein VLV81_14575 [Acidimicrobiia bacterium]|nr:hypothetical protein [Acidimicrobiia bacterium]
MRHAGTAVVEPMPPVVPSRWPWVGTGWRLVRDPTGFLAEARPDLGDTFVVDAFGCGLFCVFSPAGLPRLHALPSAIRTAVRRRVETYDLEPRFDAAAVRRRQIGGVAPADRRLQVRYRARN